MRVGPTELELLCDVPLQAEAGAPAWNSGRCRSPGASEKLQHIVPKAYQIPLRTHLTQAAQEELPKTSHLLDLTEDRFTDLLALRINRPAFDRSKFSAHPFLQACILRNSSPRHR